MSKINLSISELKILEELVIKPLSDLSVEIYFFGSRVTGKNHAFSDVDILIKTNEDLEQIKQRMSLIREALEESNFPYKVDLVLEQDLAKSYRDSILNQRVKFSAMICRD